MEINDAHDCVMGLYFECEEAGEARKAVATLCLWVLCESFPELSVEQGRVRRGLEMAKSASLNPLKSDSMKLYGGKLMHRLLLKFPQILEQYPVDWAVPTLRLLGHETQEKVRENAYKCLVIGTLIAWNHLDEIALAATLDELTWKTLSSFMEKVTSTEPIASPKRVYVAKILGYVVILLGRALADPVLSPGKAVGDRHEYEPRINTLMKIAETLRKQSSPERLELVRGWRLVIEHFALFPSLTKLRDMLPIMQEPLRDVFREGREPDSRVRLQAFETWTFFADAAFHIPMPISNDRVKVLFTTLRRALSDVDPQVRTPAVLYTCDLIRAYQTSIESPLSSEEQIRLARDCADRRRRGITNFAPLGPPAQIPFTFQLDVDEMFDLLLASVKEYTSLGPALEFDLFKSSVDLWTTALTFPSGGGGGVLETDNRVQDFAKMALSKMMSSMRVNFVAETLSRLFAAPGGVAGVVVAADDSENCLKLGHASYGAALTSSEHSTVTVGNGGNNGGNNSNLAIPVTVLFDAVVRYRTIHCASAIAKAELDRAMHACIDLLGCPRGVLLDLKEFKYSVEIWLYLVNLSSTNGLEPDAMACLEIPLAEPHWEIFSHGVLFTEEQRANWFDVFSNALAHVRLRFCKGQNAADNLTELLTEVLEKCPKECMRKSVFAGKVALLVLNSIEIKRLPFNVAKSLSWAVSLQQIGNGNAIGDCGIRLIDQAALHRLDITALGECLFDAQPLQVEATSRWVFACLEKIRLRPSVFSPAKCIKTLIAGFSSPDKGVRAYTVEFWNEHYVSKEFVPVELIEVLKATVRTFPGLRGVPVATAVVVSVTTTTASAFSSCGEVGASDNSVSMLDSTPTSFNGTNKNSLAGPPALVPKLLSTGKKRVSAREEADGGEEDNEGDYPALPRSRKKMIFKSQSYDSEDHDERTARIGVTMYTTMDPPTQALVTVFEEAVAATGVSHTESSSTKLVTVPPTQDLCLRQKFQFNLASITDRLKGLIQDVVHVKIDPTAYSKEEIDEFCTAGIDLINVLWNASINVKRE